VIKIEKNPFKWPLPVIAMILMWCTDLFFNLPSFLLIPDDMPPFTPFTNYHSDLGNFMTLNRRNFANSFIGAQFYNTGQVWMGLTIILFAGGLYFLYTEKKLQKYLVIIGQVFGILAGIALVMNGIFSEDTGEPHSFWSMVIFASIIGAELFINIGILLNPKFKKFIAYFGFATMAMSAILLFLYLPPALNYFMEFIAIYIAETWITLLALNIFYNEVWKKESKEI